MRAAAGLPLLGAAGVLLAVALFFGGGSGDGRLFWIGAGAVVSALAALTASLAGLLPSPAPTGPGTWALGLLAGFVVWNGVTIWWSVEPDRSWAYANRGLVYLALAMLGLYVGALAPRPAQVVAGGLCLLFGGVLLWALAGKVFPGLFPDGARVARLRNPVGYWNALALVCDLALPLFLWLSARRRDLGALGVYLALTALLLTYSRGGVLVGVVAVVLWLWLGVSRRESLLTLAVTLPVALAVVGIALVLPGVAKDLQPSSVRVRDGALFGVALVVGGLLVFWLARRELRRGELRALGAVAAVLVAVGAGALAAKGGWLEGFRGSDTPQVSQGPGRISSTSSNNRWIWWQEAWRVFQDEPLGGKGAGSFEVARRPQRHNSLVTIEPHNIAIQALAETGVIGLLLGGGAAIAALLAVAAAARRLEGRERAAAIALALAVPSYLLHALGDIDWDFVAAGAPVFFALGVLIGASSTLREPRRRLLLALTVAVVALASLYSLTAPWLGARRVEDAYAALDRNDPAAAVSAARDAHDLNPLSLEPLWAWALAEALAGNTDAAVHQYLRAIALQPANSDTWYDLGAYELDLKRYKAAYRYLNEAYTRDPYGPPGEKGGLLDQARTKAFAAAK
jgi:tetratricopeptide (TPR) repeat protein